MSNGMELIGRSSTQTTEPKMCVRNAPECHFDWMRCGGDAAPHAESRSNSFISIVYFERESHRQPEKWIVIRTVIKCKLEDQEIYRWIALLPASLTLSLSLQRCSRFDRNRKRQFIENPFRAFETTNNKQKQQKISFFHEKIHHGVRIDEVEKPLFGFWRIRPFECKLILK